MSLFTTSNVERASELYLALRDGINERCRLARDHCDELWREFSCYADENFKSDFPAHLHQRWFEMYLTVSLMRLGIHIDCPKPGPDIRFKIGGKQVCIEATCSSTGEIGKPDSVPSPVYDAIQSRPINQTLLRIRSSLLDKERKIQKYRNNGIISDDAITLVAINIFDACGGHEDMSDCFKRALFGFAGTSLVICEKPMKTANVRSIFQSQIQKLSNGEGVGVRPFADGSIPGVSGVIASSTNVLNRDWPPARLGASIMLFPNTTATIPYQAGLIPLGVEVQTSGDINEGWIFTEGDHEIAR